MLALGTVLQAQPVGPRIGYIYPAGGQQGATFQVVVAGQYLGGVSGAFVSGAGVQAKVIEHIEPLTVEQGLLLKDKLTALQEKKAAARQNGTP